jgi:hypothetical protein
VNPALERSPNYPRLAADVGAVNNGPIVPSSAPQNEPQVGQFNPELCGHFQVSSLFFISPSFPTKSFDWPLLLAVYRHTFLCVSCSPLRATCPLALGRIYSC